MLFDAAVCDIARALRLLNLVCDGVADGTAAMELQNIRLRRDNRAMKTRVLRLWSGLRSGATRPWLRPSQFTKAALIPSFAVATDTGTCRVTAIAASRFATLAAYVRRRHHCHRQRC